MDERERLDSKTTEHLLESLTGIKASKPTYYSEYRDKARRLDRAIASIASISAALSNTTNGVAPLARAVVGVAAQHFDAERAILLLLDEPSQRWVARRERGEIEVLEDASIPPRLESAVAAVLGEQRLVVNEEPLAAGRSVVLGAPMVLSDEVIGALAVAPPQSYLLDERDVLVLQTLAGQAAVAIKSALLFEESERLRTQATELYRATNQQKSELEEKNRQLEKASHWLAVARQNEVVHHERNRIARELHDNVAQHLLSIGMNLEWCRVHLESGNPVFERVSIAKELARSAVGRIRATIFELSGIGHQHAGLVVGLYALSSEFERATFMNVQVRSVGEIRPVATEIEQALYHIAQEALFNAYKHARTQTITLLVSFRPHAVSLAVSDDGVGIAPEYCQSRGATRSRGGAGHYGLDNMRRRAREVGGVCTISRRRPHGTVVRVRVPTSGR